MYQGIVQFNAGIGGTDEYTHRWYVYRMDAGPDDQELTAKIRETCLKTKQPFFIFTLKSRTYVFCVKGPFIKLKGPNRGQIMVDCNHTWLSCLLDRYHRRPTRSRVKNFIEYLGLRDLKEDIDIHAEAYLVQTTNSMGKAEEKRWPSGDELFNHEWKMEEFLRGTLSCKEHFQTGILKL